jgi:hypothetical protein
VKRGPRAASTPFTCVDLNHVPQSGVTYSCAGQSKWSRT